jgi:hypothetical protein
MKETARRDNISLSQQDARINESGTRKGPQGVSRGIAVAFGIGSPTTRLLNEGTTIAAAAGLAMT